MGLKTRNNRANQSSSKQFDHRLQEGLALHKQGYLEQAQSIYEEIIRLSPHHFDALQLLGTIAGQKSEWQRAASFISKALKINPLHPVAWNNLGNVKNELKQYKEALACYDKAIALDLVYADAHYNRGNVLKELHQLPESLDSYKKAIALQSTESEFFYNQGIVLQDLKRFEEALQSFDQAIALNPSFSKAHNNRGAVLNELERFDEALIAIERAIELDKNYAQAHYNLGTVLVNLMRVDEAIRSFDSALHLNPKFVEAINNRAILATGKIDKSLEETNKAPLINPDLPDAHFNRSLCHLLQGNFSDGWKGYEWRFRLHSAIGKNREFLQPLWLGNFTIENKTILLHAEQGLGDTIQFCRYVDLVYERGARIILEIQKPLVSLMKKLPGGISLISDGDQLPDFDCHCPLLSLPLAFKTDRKSVV